MMVRHRLWLTFAVAMMAILALGSLTVVLALRARHAQESSRAAKTDVGERVALSMEFRDYVAVVSDIVAGRPDDGHLTLARLKISGRLASISRLLAILYQTDPDRGRRQGEDLQAFATDFTAFDRRVQELVGHPLAEPGSAQYELVHRDIANLSSRSAAMVWQEVDEIYDDEGAMLHFIDTTIVITVCAAVAATAGVFFLAFVILRRISGSLGRLHQAALRFAKGRTAERFSAPGTDEFGALGAAFNQALDQGETLRRVEKLATVGQLAASVAHELRSPFGALRNAHRYLERRLTGIADERVMQFLGIMDRELRSSSKIVSDLLDFARERKPARGPCPLRPLVADAFSVIELPANVRLANEVPVDLPAPQLDRDMFRQVLINLVQNGVDALGSERPDAEVRIEASVEAGEVALTVRDNGPGIAPEALGRLFEPLFSTKAKGTGLGLAIARSIVQRHDGQLDVTSTVGQGATFHVRVPVDRAV